MGHGGRSRITRRCSRTNASVAALPRAFAAERRVVGQQGRANALGRRRPSQPQRSSASGNIWQPGAGQPGRAAAIASGTPAPGWIIGAERGRRRRCPSGLRLVDWCADLSVFTTAFHPRPSIATGVAPPIEGRTGRRMPPPAAQQAVAADEAATFNSEPVHIVGFHASW